MRLPSLHKCHVFAAILALGAAAPSHAANPIITDVFTADPAAMVCGDTVYLYTGHDEAKPKQGYFMQDWLCYSSKDMKTWTSHGAILSVKDFPWATSDAWASQVIERAGKFYWYINAVTSDHAKYGNRAIGVAVSDSPTGPFKDAIGAPLVTDKMTFGAIDPTVIIDDDGQAYLFWGNPRCYYAKLKPNMIELDGDIQPVDGLPDYTEAPWVHKRGNIYYLSYSTGFPEKTSYSTAPKITGPWTPRGLLAEGAFNSSTIHQAIIEFKGQWYFVYHNGAIQRPSPGGSSRRSVCIDYLYYNPDGTMKRVVQTTEGLDLPPQ